MTRSDPYPRSPIAPPYGPALGKRCYTSLLRGATWAGLALLLPGCRHDNAEIEELAASTVQQRLAIDFNYSGHGYELASTYADTLGHLFRLDTLSFIISGVQARDDDQSLLAQYDGDLVASAAHASNDFLLGPLTAGHLHQLRFSLGLIPEVNHTGPPSENDTTGMSPMYTGSSAGGYRFLHISGQVDGNGDGALDASDPLFSFKCAGDAMLRSNIAPVHADLVQGSVLKAWLPVDIEKLLAGIDLLATPSSDGSAPINARLMDQLVNATTQTH